MQSFATFSDLLGYVPNCLICEKPLSLMIVGHQANLHKNLKLPLGNKDGMLYSLNRQYTLIIDPQTNEILNDFNNILTSVMIEKKCHTCHLKVITQSSKSNRKFGPCSLHREELSFTMPGGKKVDITKHYYPDSINGAVCRTTIMYNHRYSVDLPFDFNQIKDLSHLRKRLGMLVTFQ